MNKDMLKALATDNHKIRSDKFVNEINHSISESKVYTGSECRKIDAGVRRYSRTYTNLICNDIASYLKSELSNLSGKTAVLNFASYNNPGGKYINGSMAQEEALCHCSTLYEVLVRNIDYYEWNNRNKNRGLYRDRLLYSPDIVLLDGSQEPIGKFDVMTCAAPNNSIGIRYGNFTEKECNKVMYNRILFLFHMAAVSGVDNLILGAWGCGVFKNDASFVANSMMCIEQLYDGYFRNVLYVITSGDSWYDFVREAAKL